MGYDGGIIGESYAKIGDYLVEMPLVNKDM